MKSKKHLPSNVVLHVLGMVFFLPACLASASGQATTPSSPVTPVPAAPKAAQPTPAPQSAVHSPYTPNRFPKLAKAYYENQWGIDSITIKAVESGELIRFSYRVLDPGKAKILNDKKTEAFLIAPARNIKLVIPSLEKVGQLRQGNAPQAGTSYWMAFSNPHRDVKRGDRVNVVIGQFHADGIMVD